MIRRIQVAQRENIANLLNREYGMREDQIPRLQRFVKN